MSITNINGGYTLNNGVQIPYLGLGLYKVENSNVLTDLFNTAVDLGYRHFDTATRYGNEEALGHAIKQATVPREQLFITTKIWITDQGYKQTFKAFDNSLNKLQSDYIDLYLIHWPTPELYIETWHAMEELYQKGKIKAIGVSNCEKHHLETLFASSTIKPAVNQIEFHPHLVQNELLQYCHQHDIRIGAWSSLKRGQIFDEPYLIQLADKYNKTLAQIVLRWILQKDMIVIPKSANKKRIAENTLIFDFVLTEDEITQIDNLNKNDRIGAHPDSFMQEFKARNAI